MKRTYAAPILRRFLSSRLVGVMVLGILLFSLGQEAWGCPTCKDGIDGGAAGGNLARGFYWSILFMMAMPFALIGSFAGYMYWQVRRARQSQSEEPGSAELAR